MPGPSLSPSGTNFDRWKRAAHRKARRQEKRRRHWEEEEQQQQEEEPLASCLSSPDPDRAVKTITTTNKDRPHPCSDTEKDDVDDTNGGKPDAKDVASEKRQPNRHKWLSRRRNGDNTQSADRRTKITERAATKSSTPRAQSDSKEASAASILVNGNRTKRKLFSDSSTNFTQRKKAKKNKAPVDPPNDKPLTSSASSASSSFSTAATIASIDGDMLHRRLQESQHELERTRQELQKSRRQCHSFKQQAYQYELEVEDARSEISSLQQTHDQLQQSHQFLQSDHEQLRQDHQALQTQHDTVHGKYRDVVEKYKRWWEKLKTWSATGKRGSAPDIGVPGWKQGQTTAPASKQEASAAIAPPPQQQQRKQQGPQHAFVTPSPPAQIAVSKTSQAEQPSHPATASRPPRPDDAGEAPESSLKPKRLSLSEKRFKSTGPSAQSKKERVFQPFDTNISSNATMAVASSVVSGVKPKSSQTKAQPGNSAEKARAVNSANKRKRALDEKSREEVIGQITTAATRSSWKTPKRSNAVDDETQTQLEESIVSLSPSSSKGDQQSRAWTAEGSPVVLRQKKQSAGRVQSPNSPDSPAQAAKSQSLLTQSELQKGGIPKQVSIDKRPDGVQPKARKNDQAKEQPNPKRIQRRWQSTIKSTFYTEPDTVVAPSKVAKHSSETHPLQCRPTNSKTTWMTRSVTKPNKAELPPDDLFDSQFTQPDYKYEEVVRKKKERQALNGHACPECGKFWDAVCRGNEHLFKRQHFEECSRHRSKHSQPRHALAETPPHFWEASFRDEVKEREGSQAQR